MNSVCTCVSHSRSEISSMESSAATGDSEDFPLMIPNGKYAHSPAVERRPSPHLRGNGEDGCLKSVNHHLSPRYEEPDSGSCIHLDHMDPKYQDIWYELGSPVAFPFLKFIFAIVLWILENFFLIMNTLNAIWIREGNSPELKRERILIASLTIGFHVGSCIIISFIDSLNKVAISGKAWSESKRFAIFRLIAHGTLTMKFLRYFSAYLENRKKNKKILKIHKQRQRLTEEEIQFVVDIKKNDLVDCHYDVIEIFFKNVPAALLQVFLMFQTSPAARLKLTTRIDIYRFLTVFFTIISGSALTTNYQISYHNYQKVLHFQDCFRSKFKHSMNLNVYGGGTIIALYCNQLLSIGIRICFYSLIIFWNPQAYLIILPSLAVGEWLIAFTWCRTSWRFRPVLENPLFGLPALSLEFIDSWINLYSPGVHYLKFIHHLFSGVILNGIALCVFQGFASITTPGGQSQLTLMDKKVPNFTEEAKTSDFDVYSHFNKLLNCTTLNTNETIFDTFAEDEYFIGSVINVMLRLHEYVTLNEIPYVFVFFYVVKFSNVVSILIFTHICLMNFYNKFETNFPIQIAHDFYVTILNEPFTPTIAKRFLVVNLLPNSDFFRLFNRKYSRVTLAKMSEKKCQKLFEKLEQQYALNSRQIVVETETNEPENSTRCVCTNSLYKEKIFLFLQRVFFPESLRIPDLTWDNVDCSRESILTSIKHHALYSYLKYNLVNAIYDDSDEQTKLLLAVFCKNIDSVLRNTTSYRIQITFSLLQIKVYKGCARTLKHMDEVDGRSKRHLWDIIVKDFVEI